MSDFIPPLISSSPPPMPDFDDDDDDVEEEEDDYRLGLEDNLDFSESSNKDDKKKENSEDTGNEICENEKGEINWKGEEQDRTSQDSGLCMVSQNSEGMSPLPQSDDDEKYHTVNANHSITIENNPVVIDPVLTSCSVKKPFVVEEDANGLNNSDCVQEDCIKVDTGQSFGESSNVEHSDNIKDSFDDFVVGFDTTNYKSINDRAFDDKEISDCNKEAVDIDSRQNVAGKDSKLEHFDDSCLDTFDNFVGFDKNINNCSEFLNESVLVRKENTNIFIENAESKDISILLNEEIDRNSISNIPSELVSNCLSFSKDSQFDIKNNERVLNENNNLKNNVENSEINSDICDNSVDNIPDEYDDFGNFASVTFSNDVKLDDGEISFEHFKSCNSTSNFESWDNKTDLEKTLIESSENVSSVDNSFVTSNCDNKFSSVLVDNDVIEDDDFDDFKDFESSDLTKGNSIKTEVEYDSFDIIIGEPNFEDLFPTIGDTSSDVQLDELNKSSVWKHLSPLENSSALNFHWSSSQAHNKMLSALSIDARNILFGPHWNDKMPRFAANLGLSPLQPMKATETMSSLSSSTTPAPFSSEESESVPDPHFDWNGSGLTNPLDSGGGGESHFTLLLDLNLLSTFDSLSANQNVNDEDNSKSENCIEKIKVLDSGVHTIDSANVMSSEAERFLSSLPDLSFVKLKDIQFKNGLIEKKMKSFMKRSI